MTLAQLLAKLPQYEIEDHSYDIGYWSRVAGEPRPSSGAEQQAGWDRANRELAAGL